MTGTSTAKVILRALLVVICAPLMLTPSESNATSQLGIVQPPFSRGIGEPVVSAILVDRSDLVWVGTQEGLYRYDGLRTQLFSIAENNQYFIPNSDVRAIAQDSLGRVIVATFGGGLLVSSPDGSRFRRLAQLSAPEYDEVTSIYEDESGNFWLTTESGIVVLDKNLHKKTNTYFDDLPTGFGPESRLTQSDDGTFFVSGSAGNLSFKSGQIESAKPLLLYQEKPSQLFEHGPENSLFATTPSGNILRVDAGSKEIVAISNDSPIPQSSIQSMVWVNDNLWVGSSHGLLLFNKNLELLAHKSTSNSDLSNNYITHISHYQGDLWLATLRGINVAFHRNVGLFTNKNSGIHDEVLAFEIDQRNRLWVGTYDGLFFRDLNANTHEKWEANFGRSLVDQRIMTLAQKGKHLWIGLRSGGVEILDTEESELFDHLDSATDQLAVTKILHDTSGRTWVATYNKGLFLYEQKFSPVQSISEDSVIILEQGISGSIYAASERRIYLFDESKSNFRHIEVKFHNQSLRPMILSLEILPNNELLVGTKDHGLFLSQHSEDSGLRLLKRFGEAPGIEEASIYSIEREDNGRIWTGTNRGIYALDEEGILESRLLKKDGLQGNDFNFAASLQTRNGSLLFGGIDGYNSIEAGSIQEDHKKFNLRMISIESPQGEFWTASNENLTSIELSHKDYYVTFSFATTDFLSSEPHYYRYQLVGFDPEWVDSESQNSAKYTNLPPGNYRFQVQVADSSGRWNENGISVNVKALPPPWLTWWAYVTYFLMFCATVWSAKRIYYTHVVKEEALEMANEMVATTHQIEDELQEQQELQDELIAEAHEHSRENLALIEAVILKLEDSTRVQHSIRILQSLEESFHHGPRGLVVNFHTFADNIISSAIAQSAVPAERLTTINTIAEADVPAREAGLLALALDELLQNAIQHAFEADRLANFIEIGLEAPQGTGQQSYTLSVSDDGMGLADDVEVSSHTSGFGLLNRLAAYCGGAFNVKSSIGTRATFTVPVSTN